MRWNTIITEQEPTKGGSIYCSVKTQRKDGFITIAHGSQDYFVCDGDRNVTQYFQWMVSDRVFRRALRNQGYTLKLR